MIFLQVERPSPIPEVLSLLPFKEKPPKIDLSFSFLIPIPVSLTMIRRFSPGFLGSELWVKDTSILIEPSNVNLTELPRSVARVCLTL